MEKVHAAILLLGILFAVCARSGEAQDNRTVYTLGYLAPSEDSPIPTSLVIEWSGFILSTMSMTVVFSKTMTSLRTLNIFAPMSLL